MKEQTEKQQKTIHASAQKFLSIIDSNPYARSEEEKDFLRTIIELYETYPKHYVKMLLSKKNEAKYGKLVAWIDECIKGLLVDTDDFKYSLNAKLNWIVHGRTAFQKCRRDGCNNIVGEHVNYRLADDINEFCSNKCSTGAESVISKSRDTRLSHNANCKWNSDETIKNK